MVEHRKKIDLISEKNKDNNIDARLKLDLNENVFGCNKKILSTLRSFDFDKIAYYADYENIYKKIAQEYNLKKEEITFSNLELDIISSILNAYLEDDEEILSNDLFNESIVNYSILNGKNTQFIVNKEAFLCGENQFIEKINEKTKIIYISNPNSITGSFVPFEQIENLIRTNSNKLFVINCEYMSFSKNLDFDKFISLIKNYDNVVVLKSFDKDFAIASLGFCIALADEKIIKNINKLLPRFSLNAFSAFCALSFLNQKEDIEKIKENNDKQKQFLIDEISKHKIEVLNSDANFVLCNFQDKCEFYFNKFKNNGVLTKKFPKDSDFSNYLQIAVATNGATRYVSKLLEKKDLIVFCFDNVVFDVRNSYIEAISRTFEYFSGLKISKKDILNVKNYSKIQNDWEVAQLLLLDKGYDIEIGRIIDKFQEILSLKSENSIIDNHKLIFSVEILEELSVKYDLALFSEHLKDETIYSLEKYEILKYFSYIVTSDDLPRNMLKPNSKGLLEILEKCSFNKVTYFGSSVNDAICAHGANVDFIGIASSFDDYTNLVNAFRHHGAKSVLGEVENIISFLEVNENEIDSQAISQ